MKKRIRIFAALLACLSLFALSGCMSSLYERRAVGTWEGDGSLDIVGLSAPFEYAQTLSFGSDGSLTATVDGEERSFRYSMTDDTLTVNGEEESWGLLYEIKGDSLTLGLGNNSASFTKTD